MIDDVDSITVSRRTGGIYIGFQGRGSQIMGIHLDLKGKRGVFNRKLTLPATDSPN